jgi:Zn ribbon nucleic-acid-binding protein
MTVEYPYRCRACKAPFLSREKTGASCPTCRSADTYRDWKAAKVAVNYHPTKGAKCE